MLEGKTIFITGGAGFIGANLIKRLINSNKIYVLDTLTRNALSALGIDGYPNLKIIKGSVLDYESLKSNIPSETDIVLHMAAIAGIDTVTKNPVLTMEVNMIGTHYVLRALLERGLISRLERFVGFSTGEVFGTTAFRVTEDTPSTLQLDGEARWTYAVAKLASEYLLYSYYKEHGLRAVVIRPFNIYGIGQIGEGAIRQLVLRALRNEPITIYGDGSQIRSWCYVDDMVEGILLALTKDTAIGQAFNIGNPRATLTILNLAEKIIQLTHAQSRITFLPKTVDVELRIPDISKARKLLGFEPKVDLDEGLRNTIAWYRERLEKRQI